MSNEKLILLAAFGVFGLAAVFAPLLPPTRAQESVPVPGAAPDTKTWQAVAPGRVEPWSEQLRIGSPVPGRVAEVLVKISDTVFAGEALIRIDNIEVRTNLAKVEAEVNLRKRGRANPPAAKDARAGRSRMRPPMRNRRSSRPGLLSIWRRRRDGPVPDPTRR